MELVSLETLELPDPSAKKAANGAKERPSTSKTGEEDIFGLDDDSAGVESIDLEDIDSSEAEVPEEQETGDEEDDAEQILTNFLDRLEQRKIPVGINIRQGKTVFQSLENVDIKKMKKKDREEYLMEKLSPIYDEAIAGDQYTWDVQEDGSAWLASYESDLRLLNILDLANVTSKGDISIQEMMPDEALWTGLVRSHYELPDDEFTGLIGFGENASRIVFLKGDRIFHVLPVISEGTRSVNFVQTVFSKLLFEIDKGTLPGLDRLIIMHAGKQAREAREFFEKQLGDVSVQLFEPDPQLLIQPDSSEMSAEQMLPYVTAIGAAQAAAGVETKRWPALSMIPDYIKERQQVFKLEWHGMILLVLIALAPALLNHWYKDYVEQREDLQADIQVADSRMIDLQQIVDEVTQLSHEQAALEELNQRVLEVSRQNLLWSNRLDNLNVSMADIPNTWLTSLRIADDDVTLSGYTLYRQRIPLLLDIYEDVRVSQVSESEIRGNRVYQFTLHVSNFRPDDEDRFSPQPPELETEIAPEAETQYLEP